MQDGILQEDNFTNSLNSAWNDSSSAASTHGSSVSGRDDDLVLFVPPLRRSPILVDVAISAATLQVNISVLGNDIANVLINDLVPRNVFTAYLSRSIMNVVFAFWPWSSGCGLPSLATQVAMPPISFNFMAGNEEMTVYFAARINEHPPACSSVVISDVTDSDTAVVDTVTDVVEDSSGSALPDSLATDALASSMNLSSVVPNDRNSQLAPTVIVSDDQVLAPNEFSNARLHMTSASSTGPVNDMGLA